MKEENRGLSIKKRSNSDIAILKRNDSFVELKEGRSSSHSIHDIFQESTSQVRAVKFSKFNLIYN